MHNLRSTCSNPVQFIENELLSLRRMPKAIPCCFISENLMRISFVDEDWSKLSSDALSTRIEQGFKACKAGIHDRILYILKDGNTIGLKKFEFLAFSASQLRANSCWMFSSNGDVTSENIRNWMGDFNKISSVS
ncbi:putative RNA-dependent RNA polymerase 2 [Platanthera zijinensis]|uniref:RNA-dependent RNA polymerase n=1 Tax=Platanthera zijinensis TaxID=2320716 RepID=A0AAP0GEB7_9ASPA